MLLLLALSLTNAVLHDKYQKEAEVKRILDSPHFKKMSRGMDAPGAAQITASRSRSDGYTKYSLGLAPKAQGGVISTCELILDITILPYPPTNKGREVFGLGYLLQGVVEAAPGRTDKPPVPSSKFHMPYSNPEMPSIETTPIEDLKKALEYVKKHPEIVVPPFLPIPSFPFPSPVLPPLYPLGLGPVISPLNITGPINPVQIGPIGPLVPPMSLLPPVVGKQLDAKATEYTLKVGEMGYLSQTAGAGYEGAQPAREQLGSYHANDSKVVRCEFAKVPTMLCGGIVCQQRFYAEKPGTTMVTNDRSNQCYKITVTK